jgi:hypothetical protein
MSGYTLQLQNLLEELLENFEYDPGIGYYTFETDGGPAVLSEELSDLLDRANDLLFEVGEDDEL